MADTDGCITTRPTLTAKQTKGWSGKSHHPPRRGVANKFIAVDGEGVTDAFGDHKYVLLGVGDQQIINKNGLHWEEIFEFLWDNFQKGVVYCGFYLGYDFTQWLKSLPEDKAWLLVTDKGRALRRPKKRMKFRREWPVRIGCWDIDILGNKKLSIRKRDCVCESKCDHVNRNMPYMTICDVGPFFQAAFLKVINPDNWPEGECPVTPEEYEDIKRGKERRETAVLDKEMMRYNLLENDILARIMERYDEGLRRIGVKLGPTTYHGPGQAAQQWLKNNKCITAEELPDYIPDWVLEAARMSYYGGWFEIMMHGIVPEAHEYDINSAYPHIIASLPCLRHVEITKGDTQKPPEGYTLVYCTAFSPAWDNRFEMKYIGPLPYRTKQGRIRRPTVTRGWYWKHEVEAAHAAGLIELVEAHEWISFTSTCTHKPLAGIKGLYDYRKRLHPKSPLGIAAKLIYNSMYGKFAQSVGVPLYGNAIYASLITAGCRTMILEAIASHPKGKSDVAMVATDGIYFRTEHPNLLTGKELGQWDHKKLTNLALFKPGVYWHDENRRNIASGKNPGLKTRGVNATDFANVIASIDREYSSWRSGIPEEYFAIAPPNGWPNVTFRTRFAMVTAKLALSRGKWDTAGKVTQGVEVKQSANPVEKRWIFYRDGDIFRTEPLRGFAETVDTHPYEKRFGMDDPFSEEFKEQFGITPDGPNPGAEWAWAFKEHQ